MIQVYDRENTNYKANGDMTLEPILCDYSIVLNGECEIELEHQIDELGRWKYLKEENVLSCPTPHSEKQLFRIYKKVKNMDSITVYARPIFFDCAREMLIDVRPTNKSAQEALNIMFEGTPFSAETDITKVNTAYYIRKNRMEALASDDENSFVNRWGGERLYDNYKVVIHERIGGDYGVSAEFGKNLEAIEEEMDMDEVMTRIVPVSYNGYTLDGEKPWIDSPNIDKYSLVYMKEVKFEDIKLTEDASDDDEISYDTIEELQAALIKASKELFEQGVDVPGINYVVNMVELSDFEEYQDYEMLERISIGDTVKCKHTELDINIKSRCISLVYDCINEKNKEVELGNFTDNYFDQMSSVYNRVENAITPSGDIRGEYVKGVLNGMQTQFKAQRSVEEKQIARAILFEDLDPKSSTYGAMSLGTQGFAVSNERTANGRDWKWKTFGTASGFVADLIVTGLLSSKNYVKNSSGTQINLDRGTIDSKNFKLSETGDVTITGGDITLTGLTNSTSKIKVVSAANANFSSEISPAQFYTKNASQFAALRASGITWGALSGNVGDTKGSLYVSGRNTMISAMDNDQNLCLTSASGDVIVGTPGSYRPIYASSFLTSSQEHFKTNIQKFENALDEVMNTDIYSYNLKTDIERGSFKKKIGAVISSDKRLSQSILSADGISIDQYSMISVLWQAVKELTYIVQDLRR